MKDKCATATWLYVSQQAVHGHVARTTSHVLWLGVRASITMVLSNPPPTEANASA